MADWKELLSSSSYNPFQPNPGMEIRAKARDAYLEDELIPKMVEMGLPEDIAAMVATGAKTVDEMLVPTAFIDLVPFGGTTKKVGDEVIDFASKKAEKELADKAAGKVSPWLKAGVDKAGELKNLAVEKAKKFSEQFRKAGVRPTEGGERVATGVTKAMTERALKLNELLRYAKDRGIDFTPEEISDATYNQAKFDELTRKMNARIRDLELSMFRPSADKNITESEVKGLFDDYAAEMRKADLADQVGQARKKKINEQWDAFVVPESMRTGDDLLDKMNFELNRVGLPRKAFRDGKIIVYSTGRADFGFETMADLLEFIKTAQSLGWVKPKGN